MAKKERESGPQALVDGIGACSPGLQLLVGMNHADARYMHPLPFALKRGHLASVAWLRALASKYNLTPARFDLLFALHRSRYSRPYQYWLATRLGVARSTICRMIHAMQTAGLVELEPALGRGRPIRISLTRLGRKCFAGLLKVVRRGIVAARVRFAWIASKLARWESRMAVAQTIEAVSRYSRGIDEHTTLYPIDRLTI